MLVVPLLDAKARVNATNNSGAATTSSSNNCGNRRDGFNESCLHGSQQGHAKTLMASAGNSIVLTLLIAAKAFIDDLDQNGSCLAAKAFIDDLDLVTRLCIAPPIKTTL